MDKCKNKYQGGGQCLKSCQHPGPNHWFLVTVPKGSLDLIEKAVASWDPGADRWFCGTLSITLQCWVVCCNSASSCLRVQEDLRCRFTPRFLDQAVGPHTFRMVKTAFVQGLGRELGVCPNRQGDTDLLAKKNGWLSVFCGYPLFLGGFQVNGEPLFGGVTRLFKKKLTKGDLCSISDSRRFPLIRRSFPMCSWFFHWRKSPQFPCALDLGPLSVPMSSSASCPFKAPAPKTCYPTKSGHIIMS